MSNTTPGEREDTRARACCYDKIAPFIEDSLAKNTNKSFVPAYIQSILSSFSRRVPLGVRSFRNAATNKAAIPQTGRLRSEL
jgi:hypothetical protein